MLGSLDPFNTITELEMTSTFVTMSKTLAFAPQHLLSICLEARQKAYSLANIESAFRAISIVPLNSRVLTKPRVEAKEKLNQFYLRRHRTPSASYASKQMPPLPFLRQRRRAASAISFFAFLMLLNGALRRWKLQMVKQVGCALN